MVRIELMSWEGARDDASRIRFQVFVREQGVPQEIELDEKDAVCVHALAFDQHGAAIATGRLLPDGHIGRMAVLEAHRGRGIGGRILQALIARARERGDREIMLAAQVHAEAFYQAHGFHRAGAVYEEAGLPHLDMKLKL
jgi:predicted GNAT family N-acyltransferase